MTLTENVHGSEGLCLIVWTIDRITGPSHWTLWWRRGVAWQLEAAALLPQPPPLRESRERIPYCYSHSWALRSTLSFLPARRSKRGICYGDVSGWLAVYHSRYCV